ncbi:CD209 antigen-like protein C [Kryptolebias marmoratus]|uniref:CD209 antigen-like protein C n=1 Tax=Kryptolebias marmoratus TaxID=37003 RepID=UPI000D530514|nr:CD209 antigen-like protein C [Kryptolebias marmoratus]
MTKVVVANLTATEKIQHLSKNIYVNAEPTKPVCQTPTTNHRESSNNKKRLQVCVIFFGLLNVFLLTGLIFLGVRYWDLSDSAADLSTIRDNLTERLQASNDKLSFLTEERDLLKANLTEMKKELIALQSSLKKKKLCPAGWTMFWGSCYIVSGSGSWDEGRQDCRNKEADLVRFLSTFTEKSVWIGLTDKEKEGSWKWTDGTSLILTNWKKSQPDNGGTWSTEEDCADLQENGLWNDLSCSASLHWICEKVVV